MRCVRCGIEGPSTICTRCSEQLRAAAQEMQGRAWPCDRCSRAFRHEHRLNQHRRDAHGAQQETA